MRPIILTGLVTTVLQLMLSQSVDATRKIGTCYVWDEYQMSNCSGVVYPHWPTPTGGNVADQVKLGRDYSSTYGDAQPTTISSSVFLSTVTSVLSTWGPHSGIPFQIYPSALGTAPTGVSTIWFRFEDEFVAEATVPGQDPPSDRMIAFTYLTLTGRGGRILHFTTRLRRNNNLNIWQGCGSSGCSGSANQVPRPVDFESILIHEMGHALGLLDVDYYDAPIGITCGDVTMTRIYNLFDTPEGSISHRTLDSHDITGMTGLYDTPFPNSDCDLIVADPRGAAVFVDAACFADTVTCDTYDEQGSHQIVVSGYATNSGYPNLPAWSDTLTAMGGEGREARYVALAPESLAYFQWSEVDSAGVPHIGPMVPRGSRPAGWTPTFGGVSSRSVDDLGLAAVLASEEGNWSENDPNAPPSDFYCADIVVYGKADSLVTPIFNQIVQDAPGKKVRKIVGGVWNPQACKAAIFGVFDANARHKAYCASLEDGCVRTYPTDPGPELYIVGAVEDTIAGVGTSQLGYVSAACGHMCFSDYLLYDLNGDGMPDGPVARVPAKNALQAVRAATSAGDYNNGRWVETGRRVLYMIGDLDYPGTVPPGYVEGIRSEFETTGYPAVGYTSPLTLRASDYYRNSIRQDSAFVANVNSGIGQMFAYGGDSSGSSWPGYFYAVLGGFDFTRLTKRQRVIAWVPGCLSTGFNNGTFAPGNPATKGLLFGDPLRTTVACVVGHMDGGKLGSHAAFGEKLIRRRTQSLLSGSPPTIARLVFDTVRECSGGALNDHALSSAVWGGLTYLRPLAPTAVSNLAAGAGKTTATISWTEPVQDYGPADQYEIRYQAYTPLTEATFANGILVPNPPSPGEGGTAHCVELDSLSSCRAYYFAIRTKDEGLWSPISNVATASTRCSGSSIVFCMGDLLMAGGDGGGEESSRPVTIAAVGARTGLVQGDTALENSLLWWNAGGEVSDLRRLGSVSAATGDKYAVRLRQTGKRETTIDLLSLAVSDHDAKSISVSGLDRIYIGTAGSVADVRDEAGGVVSSLVGGTTEPYAVKAGQSLLVNLGGTSKTTALLVESSGGVAGANADSLGILVQSLAGGSKWTTIAMIHPRREFDRFAIPASAAGRLRLVFLHGYSVLSIARLDISETVQPQPIEPVNATVSRLGSVKEAIRQSGGATSTLSAGDTLDLEFQLPQLGTGLVRDVFLLAKGSYARDATDVQSAVSESFEEVRPTWEFALGAAYPNPSLGTVTIGYSLAADRRVELRVYDVAGRQVRSLVSADQVAGPQEIVWNGRDNGGRRVRAGVYFYRLQAGDWSSEKKVVMIQK